MFWYWFQVVFLMVLRAQHRAGCGWFLRCSRWLQVDPGGSGVGSRYFLKVLVMAPAGSGWF